jgi:hypothetical protein
VLLGSFIDKEDTQARARNQDMDDGRDKKGGSQGTYQDRQQSGEERVNSAIGI